LNFAAARYTLLTYLLFDLGRATKKAQCVASRRSAPLHVTASTDDTVSSVKTWTPIHRSLDPPSTRHLTRRRLL